MARFPDDTIGPPIPDRGPLPATVPIIPTAAPARLIPPPDARTGGVGGPAGSGLTLAALMARQKEAADRQAGVMSQGAINPEQGLAQLAWTFVNSLEERRAQKEEAAGRGQLAEAFKSFDPATGMLAPAAMDTVFRLAPDMAMDLYKTAMSLRGKGDKYGPVITGPEAQKLGLDPTKSYQLNLTTGQYDPIGGSGTSITVGTGEKLTEGLLKDTVFYPGARSAAMELEDVDIELADLAGTLGDKLPLGNFLTSPEFKKARVAGDAWIQNVLRKESGAAIPTDELEKYRITYLPQPGDDKAQIEYKRQLREQRTNDMRYGLEAGAPETLKKIDLEFDRRRAERDKRRKDQQQPQPDPNQPQPDTAQPDATTPPDTTQPAATKPDENAPPRPYEKLPRLPNGKLDYANMTMAELQMVKERANQPAAGAGP